MHWIIQNNLNFEKGIEDLKAYIISKKIPFTLVNIHRNSDSIFSLQDKEIDLLHLKDQSVCIGSYKLSKILQNKGMESSTFLNDNFSFDILKEKWRAENLLNGDMTISKIRDFEFNADSLFIRPIKDNKIFTGRLYDSESFEIQKTKLSEEWLEEEIIISSPKIIESEYRLFVVDNKIVTGSMYRLRNQVIWSDFLDKSILSFADEMIGLWQPSKAYVLDIALVNNNPKIIEINNINSAGLYKANISKIVDAIENL